MMMAVMSLTSKTDACSIGVESSIPEIDTHAQIFHHK